MSTSIPKSHYFTYEELTKRLESILGKTLGEVDTANVFKKSENNSKVTGIAGDVIEQSVLGYNQDNEQRPDIIVDTIPMEVKTTGIRLSKKEEGHRFEAKEPMSITAVSPRKIIYETFDNSNFWHKLEHMVLVYYFYDSNKVVPASDYANFLLEGYDIHTFKEVDKKRLKKDWEMVRNFILDLQNNYKFPENEYPRISSELNDKLMYIDTSPKWPNSPRFRLRRSFVNYLVHEYFEKHVLEYLDEEIDNYYDLDRTCHKISEKYEGKSVEELIHLFGIKVKDINNLNKAIAEQIVVRMFGGSSKKINNIEIFCKIGLNVKTIAVTCDGKRTEDTKLFLVDTEEFFSKDISFENSAINDYFANHQFLCILFEEKDEMQAFKDNIFLGFKRINFSEQFIESNVKKTWEEARNTVFNNQLHEIIYYDKNGKPVKNKTGVIKSTINFPKSKDNIVFFRGDSSDSLNKPLYFSNIHMYNQWIWIKGKYFVEMLDKSKFL